MSEPRNAERTPSDVPSPIDLRDPADAREWARTAQSRPGRGQAFEAFAAELARMRQGALGVLELGSGPGFLAALLLERLPRLELTLLDYSRAMHDLARTRIARHAARVRFVERDFKQPDWGQGLGAFAAVITNQAVHELRHKRHAEGLHASVRAMLGPGALYLVCDHYCGAGGMHDNALFMTVEEQRQALSNAGFSEVVEVLRAGSLVMHRAVENDHAPRSPSGQTERR